MNLHRSDLQFFIRALFNTPPLQFVSRLFHSNLRRKLVCFSLIVCLLILPMPSHAFTQFSSVASSAVILYSMPIRYVAPFFSRWFSAKPVQRRAPKETQAERINAVSSLQIAPSRFVSYQGQTLKFNAVPLNH